MNHQDMYNSERYIDMTTFLAMKNIEQAEKHERKLSDDWDFRFGDLYIADLGSGAVNSNGRYVQGGARPVVLLQGNNGTVISNAIVIVPITSTKWRKTEQPSHYLIPQTAGLHSDGIAETEQMLTIDKRQCLKYLGRLNRETTNAIKELALSVATCCFNLPEEIEIP